MQDGEAAQIEIVDGISRLCAERSGGAVVRIDTQGAVVLLAGAEAFKIRRAIRLPFLDYSTLPLRRAACEAEVELGRRSAPSIYLGALPVRRDGARLAFDGEGEIVEWVTHMRRFDEQATLDRLAARGPLSPGLVEALARALHAAGERAPVRPGPPAVAELARYVEQNRAAFAALPELFPPERARELDARTGAALATLRPLLLARGEAGRVRRGHGDLHLRNIAVIDGAPVPFDPVEFSEAIATGDVLYELAFPLMDLCERGLRREANLLLNAYLAEGDDADIAGLAALPLFLSLRAAIRAKVEAANLAHLDAQARPAAAAGARRYFDFALAALAPVPARLVAVGGLSGSGKSRLAAQLAPSLGPAPGALWLRSDVERKRLFDVAPTSPLPDAAYDREASERTYGQLWRKAELALRAGRCVLVDATHARAAERETAAATARAAGVGFVGLWLEAPVGMRASRAEARRNDASDAGAAVAARQRAEPLREAGWRELDASGAPGQTLLGALQALRACPAGG